MRTRNFRPLLIALVSVTTTSCATVPHNAQPTNDLVASQAGLPSYSRAGDRITPADLQSVPGGSTLDAVRRLRPEFLRPQPSVNRATNGKSLAEPAVYVNGRFMGGIDELSMIPMNVIEEIRLMRLAQATDKWGDQCHCPGGVIHVTTRSPIR
jgi:hypothetical protein